MTEVKIVMDDYGLLYAIFSDGSKRAIRADIFGLAELTVGFAENACMRK